MKRRTGIIIGVVALVAAAAFFLVRAAEDRVTADMVSRADRLAVPSEWHKITDIIRREQYLCMETNPCPSIQRRWETGRQLTPDDLKAVVSTAGFNMAVEGTCVRQPNVGGGTTVCKASGSDGDYSYALSVISPDKNESDIVVLLVAPVQ